MAEDSENTSLSKKNTQTGDYLALGKDRLTALDLEGLPEETKVELRKKHAEGMLDLEKRALESGIDSTTIRQRMGDMNDTVNKADPDTAVTVTGSYTDKLGRTEVIMGNTDKAKKGKLDRSQKGESDNTLLYLGIVAGVIILLAIILGN